MPKKLKIATAASSIIASILAGILFAIAFPRSVQETLSPQNLQPTPAVLAGSTTFGDILAATQSATPAAVLGAKTSQSTVTIALLGDSMVDTLGRDLKFLASSLSQYYPNVTFKLLNYGVGARKAEEALNQLDQEHTWPEQKLPPPLSVNPDIVIIESFAYNHPEATADGLKLRRQTLAKIVSEFKSKTHARILILTTIAPHNQTFALDAPGITWDDNQRKTEAQAVRLFLEDAAKYALESGLPLIDAYTPSLDAENNGKEIYIRPEDHIHPSQAGVELISDLIAQKIQELGLVEKTLSKQTP